MPAVAPAVAAKIAGGRMPASERLRLTALAAALAWAGAGIGAGCALRFLAIEPEAIGRVCASQGAALDAPFWCAVRQAVILFFHLNVIGGLALAAGAIALVGGRRAGWRTLAERIHARPLALVAGGLALVLYNAGLGATAVVLGLLAALDEV